MGTFDNFIEQNGEIFNNNWIEWDHYLIPNKPKWLREIFRNFMSMFGHCMTCTALDGCYFLETNMPNLPQHDKCDCEKKLITYLNVKSNAYAECNINKFTNYIFTDGTNSKGKRKIFEKMGFTKKDSKFLQNEFVNQALKQYLFGNYTLKKLDLRGQRLAIVIELNGQKFYSGWMLDVEGNIRNTTPFGGWIN